MKQNYGKIKQLNWSPIHGKIGIGINYQKTTKILVTSVQMSLKREAN